MRQNNIIIMNEENRLWSQVRLGIYNSGFICIDTCVYMPVQWLLYSYKDARSQTPSSCIPLLLFLVSLKQSFSTQQTWTWKTKIQGTI